MFTESKFGKSEHILEDQENQEDKINLTNHVEFHSDVSQIESSLHFFHRVLYSTPSQNLLQSLFISR